MFKINYKIVGLLLVPLFNMAQAQEKKQDSTSFIPAYVSLLKYNAPWQKSNNAAGLWQDSLRTFGQTQLSFNQTEGQFKLAQQPQRTQQLFFESERYQQIGKTLFYGSFSYQQQWDRQLRLADVLDPYRGTPYLLADSIGGDWRKQFYSLQLKAASPALLNNSLHVGLATSLNVGTGARQNDPRPLATNNEITLSPSLTWQLTKNNLLGFNVLYHRYREEVSLEVKNSNINHFLYKLLGLGQVELPTTFTTGASRVYEGNRWGAELQYQWRKENVQWFNRFGYTTHQEQVGDGTSVPQKSGTWKQEVYQLESKLLINGQRYQHRLALAFQRLEDTGIEFHEFYNNSTKSWQTLLEASFYLAQTDNATLSYTLIKPNQQKFFHELAEIGLNYTSTNRNYILPASKQELSKVTIWLKAIKNWSFKNNNSLQFGAQLAYTQNLNQYLSFVPITADRTLIARQVLYPDHAYLSTNYLSSSLSLQYHFKLPETKNVRLFVGGNYIGQYSSAAQGHVVGGRNYWRFSLGAFY